MAECGSNFFRVTLLQGAYCVRCSGLALRDGARARQFGTALADFYDPRHADRGEEVVIAKAGKPVAKLVPLDDQPKSRKLGSAKGEFTVPDDFNDPLPKEIEDLFWK